MAQVVDVCVAFGVGVGVDVDAIVDVEDVEDWADEYVRFWTSHIDDFFDAVIWPSQDEKNGHLFIGIDP